MPRLVRRRPLLERIKAQLNPLDLLLWLSEEIETRDWDHKSFAIPLGLGLNFVFLVARGATGASGGRGRGYDDVFGEEGSGWGVWVATFVVHCLTMLSVGNAIYTFARRRHYRLFESSIDSQPSTPSAQRVRVDSSPSASPLRFLSKIIASETAQSRAHPDETRDVWEVAVWDPLPICLRLFCLFSPGHVMVYWLFIPVESSNPRPSITVATTIFLQILLSAQLMLLHSNFSQQTKDTALIHKEVLNEYDIKYVHPRTNPPVRDVGTQFEGPEVGSNEEGKGEVETYTPTTILKRGFRTNPNPNYAKHIDAENTGAVPHRMVLTPNPAFKTPVMYTRRESTPIRTINTQIRQPQFRTATAGTISTNTHNGNGGDGGSLGIYSHANSPLKKAASLYDMNRDLPRNSIEMTAMEQGRARERERERSLSPNKRRRDTERGLLKESLVRGRSPSGTVRSTGIDAAGSPFVTTRRERY
jgi:hypothetical protein